MFLMKLKTMTFNCYAILLSKKSHKFTIGSRIRFWVRDSGKAFNTVKRGNKKFVAQHQRNRSCYSHLTIMRKDYSWLNDKDKG